MTEDVIILLERIIESDGAINIQCMNASATRLAIDIAYANKYIIFHYTTNTVYMNYSNCSVKITELGKTYLDYNNL